MKYKNRKFSEISKTTVAKRETENKISDNQ